MRANVDRAREAGLEIHWPHDVEEHEWPDHSSRRMGQHASDFEAAEIPAARFDDVFEHDRFP
jgi:hypothetical protein